MNFPRAPLSVFLVTALYISSGNGQAPAAAPTIVPRLVNFSGRTTDTQGKPLVGTAGVTFAIYKDQYEGAPLWMETQNVQADAAGHYTAQLGASKSDGLPLDLFSSAEARWLGVRVNDQDEQPRVLLLSVPYALQAADAQTLGGLPASAFARSTLASERGATAPPSHPSSTAAPHKAPIIPNLGGSGTQSYVPLWIDNNGTLGNSVFYQVGSGSTAKIGLNLKVPLATLDVNGTTLVRGTLEPVTKGYATATKGFSSNPLDLEASSFSSSTHKAVMQHFELQAEPTANNTASPGATLNLLFGQDDNKPVETGLKLSNAGVITFAPGQTFPNSGAKGATFTFTGHEDVWTVPEGVHVVLIEAWGAGGGAGFYTDHGAGGGGGGYIRTIWKVAPGAQYYVGVGGGGASGSQGGAGGVSPYPNPGFDLNGGNTPIANGGGGGAATYVSKSDAPQGNVPLVGIIAGGGGGAWGSNPGDRKKLPPFTPLGGIGGGVSPTGGHCYTPGSRSDQNVHFRGVGGNIAVLDSGGNGLDSDMAVTNTNLLPCIAGGGAGGGPGSGDDGYDAFSGHGGVGLAADGTGVPPYSYDQFQVPFGAYGTGNGAFGTGGPGGLSARGDFGSGGHINADGSQQPGQDGLVRITYW